MVTEQTMVIPEELDILPLFDTVVYPSAVIPLAVSQPASVQLLNTSTGESRLVGIVALRTTARRPDPVRPDDCYDVGTIALVHRLLRLPDNTLRVAVQGMERFEVVAFLPTPTVLRAHIRPLPEHDNEPDTTITALMDALITQTHQLARLVPHFNEELLSQIRTESHPRRFAYLVATATLLRRNVTERQRILEVSDVRTRLEDLHDILTADIKALQLGHSMSMKTAHQERSDSQSVYAPCESSEVLQYPKQMPALAQSVSLPQTHVAIQPGSALFLHWTPTGNANVVVEATQMPGSKGFILTGHQSDLLQDTAQVALSWVRSRSAKLCLLTHFFEQIDLHVHVPLGVTSHDSATAGIAIATALVSLLTERPVGANVALAGAMTLHGHILPIDHVSDRVLAAYQAGVTTCILPAANLSDVTALSEEIRSELQLILVDTMDQVLEAALQPRIEGRSLSLFRQFDGLDPV